MVKAIKRAFICNECSADYLRWQGRYIVCHAWNTITELHLNSTLALTYNKRFSGYAGGSGISKAQKLSEIILEVLPRFSTGFKEFNHVLGSGMVPESSVLIDGSLDARKSTLLLQTLCKLAEKNKNSVCHRRRIPTTGGDVCASTRSAQWGARCFVGN